MEETSFLVMIHVKPQLPLTLSLYSSLPPAQSKKLLSRADTTPFGLLASKLVRVNCFPAFLGLKFLLLNAKVQKRFGFYFFKPKEK